ncbi:unnamed protein product [Parajaminaea phylloscopi]
MFKLPAFAFWQVLLIAMSAASTARADCCALSTNPNVCSRTAMPCNQYPGDLVPCAHKCRNEADVQD